MFFKHSTFLHAVAQLPAQLTRLVWTCKHLHERQVSNSQLHSLCFLIQAPWVPTAIPPLRHPQTPGSMLSVG